MDVVLSALSFVFAAPETVADMADMVIATKKVAPPEHFWAGWNLILGAVGFSSLAAIGGIMVMGLLSMFAKSERLEQPGQDTPPLAKSEMTFFERLAEQRPLMGRLGTVFMVIALGAFFVMTLGSMTSEESFADKLKKEGAEKSRIERQRQEEAKNAMGAGQIGDEGERMKTEGLLDAMEEMKAD